MTIMFDIKIDDTLVTKRQGAKLLRDVRRGALERHRDRRLPGHFEANSKTQVRGAYGYRSRTPKYLKEKVRKVGHMIPNVYTGQLKRTAQTTQVTATQHKARLIVKNTGHFGLPRWQKREIEVITGRERQSIAAWMRQEAIRRMNNPKNMRRRSQRK